MSSWGDGRGRGGREGLPGEGPQAAPQATRTCAPGGGRVAVEGAAGRGRPRVAESGPCLLVRLRGLGAERVQVLPRDVPAAAGGPAAAAPQPLLAGGGGGLPEEGEARRRGEGGHPPPAPAPPAPAPGAQGWYPHSVGAGAGRAAPTHTAHAPWGLGVGVYALAVGESFPRAPTRLGTCDWPPSCLLSGLRPHRR